VRFEPRRDKLEAHTAEYPHTCVAGGDLLAQGRVDEALEEALWEPEQWGRLWRWRSSIASRVAGRSGWALHELIATQAEDSACNIAHVYAARDETDLAFEWLERA
jgi:hypothetical protein